MFDQLEELVEKFNIINVLGIAKALGWTFEIRKG